VPHPFHSFIVERMGDHNPPLSVFAEDSSPFPQPTFDSQRTQVHWPKKPAMSDATLTVRIVLTTCTSPGEASRLARTLVEEHLAACATLIPAVQSIYYWEGQIESSTETLLLLKTGPEQLAALESRLHELHNYQTPEFLVLDVIGVSHPYLDWLQASLRQP
jgi:periplasmic divalent cation tolerance protein